MIFHDKMHSYDEIISKRKKRKRKMVFLLKSLHC